ncbi:hypothetical protein EDB92DRAFT_1977634 [Lactarius akahatsu]|uniref:Uncharacterized protein n=1 Tax=Lactarius akahatsu TaxID=416441 RepID=A0AAD4L4B3_9AGAM|nr:hypothetical protein EDB92DRAFT_1977634 [Lactarius akahatsu]
MEHLPPLSIFVDYSGGRSAQGFNDAVEAFPDRVRAIAFRGPQVYIENILSAMSRLFCALEHLDVCPSDGSTLRLSTDLSWGYTPSLQYLGVQGANLLSLIPIFVSAPGLVDLFLGSLSGWGQSQISVFLSHLQQMSCLRQLELATEYEPSEGPVLPVQVVTLPRLTSLVLRGRVAHLEGIIAGLVAPSLRHLYIIFYPSPETSLLNSPIPHLSRFVRDIEKRFCAFQVGFDRPSYLMHSHSMCPFGFTITANVASVTRMVGALSDKVATVDELILTCLRVLSDLQDFGDSISWRRFFQLFPNVKVVRLQRGLECEVARFLRQDKEEPVDLLPVLEEIDLMWFPQSTALKGTEAASKLKAFEPFLAARQRSGRPNPPTITFDVAGRSAACPIQPLLPYPRFFSTRGGAEELCKYLQFTHALSRPDPGPPADVPPEPD